MKDHNISRRAVIASVPTLAATAAPATATALSGRSNEDPVLTALSAHKAAYAEIAAISAEARDKSKRGEDIDERMTDALRRADAKLEMLLITMPTTVFELACALQHLATHENNDPRQSNILIGACDAGDPDLWSAAYNPGMSRFVIVAIIAAAVILAMVGLAAHRTTPHQISPTNVGSVPIRYRASERESQAD